MGGAVTKPKPTATASEAARYLRHLVIGPSDKRTLTYYTLDNGDRPFKVTIQGSDVTIHKVSNTERYETLVGRYKAQQTFIGLSPKHDKGFGYDGNSILVHLAGSGAQSSLRYLYIGEAVTQFTAPEEILFYYSEVGPNEASYPVARSKNYVFFMNGYSGEGVRYAYIRNHIGSIWGRIPTHQQFYDAYSVLYGHKREHDRHLQTPSWKIPEAQYYDEILYVPAGQKVIQKRVPTTLRRNLLE